MTPLLEVRDLSVGYRQAGGEVAPVLHRVSLAIEPGSVVGLVGESGSGKSTLALSMLGWRPPGAVLLGGEVRFDGGDLLALGERRRRRLWGDRLAYVPQEVAVALNPARKVGPQLEEPLIVHGKLSAAERRERVLALLHSVRVDADAAMLRRYPFEFSGGQQQRMALVLAMICEPDVLVLDEPTTGVDATARLDVIGALRSLLAERGTAAVYISHDLAETAGIADRLVVMYAGEIVEDGAAPPVYARPRHPYSAALRAAVPTIADTTLVRGIPGTPPGRAVLDRCSFAARCAFAAAECAAGPVPLVDVEPGHAVRCVRVHALPARPAGERDPIVRREPLDDGILAVRSLTCEYVPGLPVLDDVSFAIAEGETLGVVGESGSGKSTLLHTISGLHRPAAGTITYLGEPLAAAARDRPRPQLQAIQLVFQNPGRSLNPRHSVARILSSPLRLYRSELSEAERRRAAVEVLDAVRLQARFLDRLPHELSGGEKQRVALARAFAAQPRVLLCDEVVSALDVSVQATIMELIRSYCERTKLTVVFVTHDLAVARMMSDRIAVFRHGALCELGPVDRIFDTPGHDYTRELVASLP